MKKMISMRIDQELLDQIQKTGDGLTAFVTKAIVSRLKWIAGMNLSRRSNEEDDRINEIIEKAKKQWKERN